MKGADPVEIEAIYRSRLVEFRRVATAIVGDADRGRDAVQDAFGSALRRRRTFRGEAPLEAWLWRLVVNQAALKLKREPMRNLIDAFAAAVA